MMTVVSNAKEGSFGAGSHLTAKTVRRIRKQVLNVGIHVGWFLIIDRIFLGFG